MTRITTILAICSCVGLLFAPAAVVGDPTGPPNGLDVNVVNTPLPVTGDVNVTNTPGVEIMNDSSEPVPVTLLSGGATVMRFVGFTVAVTTGAGGGQFGMNRMCASEFGNGARMCTSHEIFESNLTEPLADSLTFMWINPSIASVATAIVEPETGSHYWTYDLFTPDGDHIRNSSVTNPEFNCQTWTLEGSQGARMDEIGHMSMDSCSSSAHVACCGPMQP